VKIPNKITSRHAIRLAFERFALRTMQRIKSANNAARQIVKVVMTLSSSMNVVGRNRCCLNYKSCIWYPDATYWKEHHQILMEFRMLVDLARTFVWCIPRLRSEPGGAEHGRSVPSQHGLGDGCSANAYAWVVPTWFPLALVHRFIDGARGRRMLEVGFMRHAPQYPVQWKCLQYSASVVG